MISTSTLHSKGPKLSVVLPVYNERRTIEEVLRRVQAVAIDKEIIIVDAARRMARASCSARSIGRRAGTESSSCR
jgi:cellulose synthase/poly-beta-1,6-N-acetylglucosamine synthase-like glycosyltransferase